jgi:hypothetical protein
MSELDRALNAALISATELVGEMVPVEELARLRGLEAENAKLAAFAREMIEPAFDGQDVDGGTIQRVAVHYGLLTEGKYDPEKHGPSFAEPGDQWFTYAGPLAPPNAR